MDMYINTYVCKRNQLGLNMGINHHVINRIRNNCGYM